MQQQPADRACAWCRGPIPATMRRDAVCCSTRCRQARHRFVSGVGVAPGSGTGVLRLAYADPPYPGLSKRYYGDHPDYAGEVDHADLIRRLSTYDGWALSTSARALPDILALCPPGSRVAAWVRGERPVRSAGPLNAWEPVIYWGGRRDPSRGAAADASPLPAARVASRRRTRSAELSDSSSLSPRRVDVLLYRPGVRTTDPERVIGAKPAAFCRWVFDLLGAEPQDEFHDLFAGSGGVMRAWDAFTSQQHAV